MSTLQKAFRLCLYIAAILSIISGFIMGAHGGDYARGTYMVASGFGFHCVLQLGDIITMLKERKG